MHREGRLPVTLTRHPLVLCLLLLLSFGDNAHVAKGDETPLSLTAEYEQAQDVRGNPVPSLRVTVTSPTPAAAQIAVCDVSRYGVVFHATP